MRGKVDVVLGSPGTLLAVRNGQFAVVRAGQEEVRIHPSRVRNITVTAGARLTSDAVLLAIRNEIDIFFTNEKGEPEGRVWSIRYGSISTIRRNQVTFFYSEGATAWVKELVAGKVRRQASLLQTLAGEEVSEDVRERVWGAVRAMHDYARKIEGLPADVLLHDILAELRGWEGAAARRYWECLCLLLPEEWRPAGRNRRPPRDPFNSMLNYGYGILYSRVEGALIRAGLDPYMGIYHRDEYNRPALVYDFVEKYRHWIDYVVVTLIRNGAMSREMFIWEEEVGACWMDQLAKRIVAQGVIDYLSEIVTIRGVKRSREEHIQRDAHQFASMLLNFREDAPW